MRTRIILSLLTLVICLSNKLYGQFNRVDTLSFSTETGLLVLKGSLNGKDAFFAFDTGAALGVLNSSHVASSQIEAKGKKSIRDSNNDSKSMGKGKIDALKIGSFTFENVESVIYDMPFLLCNNLYLLGGDVINRLNWEFDFEKNLVFVSKEPFKPAKGMTELRVQFINNRHFTDLEIANSTFKKCLVDFGYSGVFEVSNNDVLIAQLKKEKETKGKVISSKATSMGLSSMNMGEDMSSFFIDSLKAGNSTFKNIKVNVKEKIEKKIGLKFFTQNLSTMILNNNEAKYWLQINKTPLTANLGFDADFYLINGKLEVVGKNLNHSSSANYLSMGEEIKSIENRSANSFRDVCEFLTWRLTLTKKQQFVIEKLNGEKITILQTAFSY
ncbi:MAG: aspartyl protease family protein [Bacteroidia bacterium]